MHFANFAILGTHEAMGAIWFLENPAVAPAPVGCCTKLRALCSHAELHAQLTRPTTLLAQIAHGYVYSKSKLERMFF